MEALDARRRASTLGQDVAVFALIVGVLLLIYLAIAWVWDSIFGGGLFSLFGAMGKARSGVPKIELDRDALTTLMLVPVGLAALGLGFLGEPAFRKLGFAEGGNHTTIGTILGVIAFFLFFGFSSMLSENAVGWMMTSRHYTRCAALDHHTGTGKTAIYYDSFVLHPTDCTSAR